MHADSRTVISEFRKHYKTLITPENKKFIYLALVYGLAVSLLTLAVPVSVQMLINTVANIASVNAIIILSSVLFGLLLLSGVLIANQTYILELFERRFYASMVAEFTMRNIFANQQHYRTINGQELTNRYFDIMQVQKIIPSLVAGLFASILQMLVGIVLVSFYHPWLFLFNVIFVLCIWLSWRIWGRNSMVSAINLSEAKYRTARHLEDVARSNDFLKSQIRSERAIKRTNKLTIEYLKERKHYFRYSFGQQLSFLFMYATFSALLLGIGGVLVVRSELALGQLVAAELVLSAVFFAISRLGYYLMQFYDLTAAIEEIHRIFELPLERTTLSREYPERLEGALEFSKAKIDTESQALYLDVSIPSNTKILIKATNISIYRSIADVLEGHVGLINGRVLLNNHDIEDYHLLALRDHIFVIDRSTVIEESIRNYLKLHAPAASRADMYNMLDLVELAEIIDNLPEGLDTHILSNGSPLRPIEIIRLKLAGALLAKPHILILNEYFDAISFERRQRIFKRLCDIDGITLLYFSQRYDLDVFDKYWFIDWKGNKFCESLSALNHYEGDE